MILLRLFKEDMHVGKRLYSLVSSSTKTPLLTMNSLAVELVPKPDHLRNTVAKKTKTASISMALKTLATHWTSYKKLMGKTKS
jgi:hypothetical protein